MDARCNKRVLGVGAKTAEVDDRSTSDIADCVKPTKMNARALNNALAPCELSLGQTPNSRV